MSWIKNTKLGSRLLVAGLGVPIIFVLTLLGRYYFTALILIISLVALNEFYALTKQKGYYPSSVLGLIAIICLSLDFYLTRGNSVILIIAIMIFLVYFSQISNSKLQITNKFKIQMFKIQNRIFFVCNFGFWLL